MENKENTSAGQCPVMHGANARAGGGGGTRDWWPNQLNLKMLHQNTAASNPLDEGFNYADAFQQLDLEKVKAQIEAVLTDSKS